jgi:NADH-quinone oxidoreductase subunit A
MLVVLKERRWNGPKWKFVDDPFWAFEEKYILFLALCAALLIVFALLYVSIAFAFFLKDHEKTSSYECGFQPFEDSRQRFDVKYYLVAILFIIFDIEIMCIVPWTQIYSYAGIYSVYWLFLFLFILSLGFFYEWVKGALTWN